MATSEGRRSPGSVRDAIIRTFQARKKPLTVAEVQGAVETALGGEVAASSVRSYLNNNTPGRFERVGRGKYRLVR